MNASGEMEYSRWLLSRQEGTEDFAPRSRTYQSVAISIAEKKKLTSLLSLRLHEPVVVSPQRVVIGWQILATPIMKIMAERRDATMMAQIAHTNPRRVSAIRRRVIAMLHLMATAPDA